MKKLDGRRYIEQYVQGLTHELKSPISAVRGAVEILEESDTSEKDKQHFINNIKRENERMGALIDRLLHLSKLENRKPETAMEKVNLSELVNGVISDYKNNYPDRDFSFTDSTNQIHVHGDGFLLREALDNLLRNAVDFTDANGKIAVIISIINDMAEVEITDNGQGIPDFAGERIFEKFYSLPRPKSGLKSSGLGLSIVREIAIQHGGTAKIANRQDQGVRATLTLKR